MQIRKIGITLAVVLFFAIISSCSSVQVRGVQAEEDSYIPLKAEEAIDLSQRQLSVLIELPDGKFTSNSGQGFLVSEDGLMMSARHIGTVEESEEKDKDLLIKNRKAIFGGAHADLKCVSSFYDIAIYQLRKIPFGMKPVVFAKEILLFAPVYAKLKAFSTFRHEGIDYGYELNLPYRGILVNSPRIYKNINKAPEPTNLVWMFTDQPFMPGFSGAMGVNFKGEVFGMVVAMSGGYGISVADTIQKALEECKSLGYIGESEKTSSNLDLESVGNKDAALAPDLLKALEQADIFKEILGYYDVHSLDRPKDLMKCAYEMLAMNPGGECRDRFTHYFTPEEAQARKEESSLKEYGGIGIQLKELEGKVIVIEVMAGLPAQKAGIKLGDIIIEINGIAVNKVDDAVKFIRQSGAGAEVKITINRNGELLKFVMLAEKIDVSAVTFKPIFTDAKPAVGYVKIADFMHNEVFNNFKSALVKLKQQGIHDVVIDLRNNKGGRLDYTLQMLALFMEDSNIAMTRRTRLFSIPVDRRDMSDYFNVSEFGTFRDMKVVIIINEESMSASELFAGAMQDWGAAKIIGHTSFGKGVGQACFDLSDKSLFCLTTFEFTVGNHNVVIRDKGVIPDVEVGENEDALQKALEILWSSE